MSRAVPSGAGYAVAPVFGVRVASVPVERLERMRCVETWALVDELAEVSAWLSREGAELSEPLHEAIGAAAGTPAKPLLVALRRAVYGDRRPDRRSLDALAYLPDELAHRVEAWLARREHREEVRRRLPEVLAAEVDAAVEALRHAAGADTFRRGLAQGSPVLSAQVDRWLAGRPPGRQELLGLARYVARAAAKTSPYATFTLSGLGAWAAGGPAVQPPDSLDWQGVVELDRAVLQPVWAALTRHPEVYARARLRVNPAAYDDGERIWFLGPGPAERLSSVPAGKDVRAALAWLRTHPDVAAGSVPGLRPLVQAGLVELVPPYDEQGDDPVGVLASWLPVPSLAATVRRIAEAAHGDDRRKSIDTVREALEELLSPGARAHPWLPDKNLCPESALLTGVAGRCGAGVWQALLDDLDAVRGLLGLFDSDLPAKVSAAAYFLDRYGPDASVPAPVFYRDLHTAEHPGPAGLMVRELLGNPLATPGGAGLPDLPGMRALAAARRRFWQAANAGPGGGAPVCLPVEELAQLATGWPPFVQAPGSVCCYVQVVSAPDGPRLVLGTVSAGYGRGLSRLHRLITLAGDQPPAATLLRAPQEGVRLAECRAIAGGGLNLRTATADVALAYPGTGASGGMPEVSMDELVVTYDAVTERPALRDATGCQVRPVHLGLAAQHWLPPALQFLIRVFGEPATAMVPGWVFRAGGDVPPPGVVERWPRLDVGRVTLARACVRLRAGDFPVPLRGEADAAYLPRLAAWLSAHGVARRFFARVVDLRAGLGIGLLSKGRKPMYVDVTDHLLLTGFLRSIGDPDALMVLEEALPDPADAPVYGDGERHVTEYAVQVSRS
ncbi:lantibiotic biosynthesis dehydratase-like protein [Nonomuraea polychroma]|uniref:Lantibiotic biosynthesis dehydratase-like protein n=1 Tax=Nonomuraea polychroma TaxID=46176 RepID=A0A438MI86_9ACTN|nr:lantibiotic dehydratase [Nonomuraea polychroma]RVX45514.1 lantibiotic biosynthesis dehydratase-like protein [Nonomuraea polychroma]